MKGEFIKLPVNSDLTVSSLEVAIRLHEEKYGYMPTVLVCSTVVARTAYEILLLQLAVVPKFIIVPVPSFPDDAWLLGSPHGAVFSEGA